MEELGKEFSKKEMFEVLVVDPMMGAIDVDWRDFFPYLRWIPNQSLEMKIRRIVTRRTAVTRALIMEQKKRIARGEVLIPSCCYLFTCAFLLFISNSQITLISLQNFTNVR